MEAEIREERRGYDAAFKMEEQGHEPRKLGGL